MVASLPSAGRAPPTGPPDSWRGRRGRALGHDRRRGGSASRVRDTGPRSRRPRRQVARRRPTAARAGRDRPLCESEPRPQASGHCGAESRRRRRPGDHFDEDGHIAGVEILPERRPSPRRRVPWVTDAIDRCPVVLHAPGAHRVERGQQQVGHGIEVVEDQALVQAGTLRDRRALDPAKPSVLSVSIAASISFVRVAAERDEPPPSTTLLDVPDFAIAVLILSECSKHTHKHGDRTGPRSASDQVRARPGRPFQQRRPTPVRPPPAARPWP